MHQKKTRLRDRTDRSWFSRLLRHPARKRSWSILTTPEPAQDYNKRNFTESMQQQAHHHHQSSSIVHRFIAVQKVSQIWHVATAMNDEQCALKLSTSPNICTHDTHCLVMLQETKIVTK